MDGSSYSRTVIGSLSPGLEVGSAGAIAPMALQAGADWITRFAHPLCVAVAAFSHLALALLFLPATTDALGDGGTALEAIAVDMVDAIPSDAAPQIAASQASTAETVEEMADAAPPVLPAEQKPILEMPLPRVATETAVPPLEPLPERETPRDKPQEAEPQPPPAVAQPASVGSISAAEASPGIVHAYGARIARIINQGRPRGSLAARLKGKVVLAFAVDPAGRIERAEVHRSSGNPELDSRALDALQKLSFPAPAAEMSERQRNFTVPFEFR